MSGVPVRRRSQAMSTSIPLMTDGRAAKWLPAESDVLLVGFGGMAADATGPRFELEGATSDLGVNRLLVRDVRRSWYHLGIEGASTDIAGCIEALGDVIDRVKPSRTIFIGASSGGYAALLFGERLGVDVVHAFAPQTFISLPLLRAKREPRWRNRAEDLEATGRFDASALDLRSVLVGVDGVTAHHLWFDPDERSDAVHADNVAGCSRLVLHPMAGGDHLVVKWMRDVGYLGSVLQRSALGETIHAFDDERDARLIGRSPRLFLARQRWRGSALKQLLSRH